MASQSKKDRSEATLQRSLVVRGCEIGTVTHGHFQSYTNFSMDIVHAVSSPNGAKPTLFGYVYSVKTSSGHQSDCFVSTDDSATVRSFVRSASKSNPHLQAAKISDKLWSLYVLNMAKEYQNCGSYKQMTLVSRVGKQPNSRTWVLSPDTQIDGHGRLIPHNRQEFFWHEEYIHMLIKARVVPISVITPLSPQPMIHLLRITKRCLDNNFLSSLVTLAGAVIVLHYEDVLGIQDECPLVLCFSPSPGSGKSTTLRNTFSILGADQVHITGPDTHPAVIVSRAAGTTIPLGIDDIRSARKAESIAVQFFNGFSHNTCQSGELKPHTSVIITSNSTFCSSERNSQRILHIPFFPPTKPTSPADLRRCEMMLKKARVDASASIGSMIALGTSLMSQESQHYLDQIALPLVTEYLPNVHFRVQKCYALLLTAAKLLCKVLPSDIVQYQEVTDFFTNTMSPLICQLHSTGSSVLSHFLHQLIGVLKPLRIHEVLQMVRPAYVYKKVSSVALYMPMVRELCGLSPDVEKQLKDAIKAGGGAVNGSALFLPTTSDSTATYVCRATGINRRAVAFIPHSLLNPGDLEKLNAACNETESDDSNDETRTPSPSPITYLEDDESNDRLPEEDTFKHLCKSITACNETESDNDSNDETSTPSPSQITYPEDSESVTPDNHLEDSELDILGDHLPKEDISPSLSSVKSVKHPPSLVPFTDDQHSPVLSSTPKCGAGVLVSTDVHADALIHPITKAAPKTTNGENSSAKTTKERNASEKTAEEMSRSGKTTKERNASKKKSSSVKEQCPPDRCVMKRANKRTWWVQCAQCTQWYHIKCAKLTKQEAQDNEFTCEDCI